MLKEIDDCRLLMHLSTAQHLCGSSRRGSIVKKTEAYRMLMRSTPFQGVGGALMMSAQLSLSWLTRSGVQIKLPNQIMQQVWEVPLTASVVREVQCDQLLRLDSRS